MSEREMVIAAIVSVVVLVVAHYINKQIDKGE